MSETLAERLARARASTGPELAEATEKLNTSLARAEVALRALNLGVSATVDFEPENEDGFYQCLSFERQGESWGLFVFWGVTGEPDANDKKPLLRASRDDRIRAAEILPELVDALISAAEEKAREVRASAEKIDALVDELNTANAPQAARQTQAHKEVADLLFNAKRGK